MINPIANKGNAMKVEDLHPRTSDPKVISAPIPGEKLINSGGVIELARRGETPQAKRLYRLFLAEYRALAGAPMAAEAKEQQALIAAMRRMNFNLIKVDA